MITQSQINTLNRRAFAACPSIYEDLVQDALEHTLKYWDETKGASFWTLAYTNVNHFISKALKKKTREYVGLDDDLGDSATVQPRDLTDLQLVQRLAQEFGAGLPDPDREIWFTHLMTMPRPHQSNVSDQPGRQPRYKETDRGRWASIARSTNCSRQRVEQCVKRREAQFIKRTRSSLCL